MRRWMGTLYARLSFVIVFILMVQVFAFAGENVQQKSTFNDIAPNFWGNEAIAWMSTIGAVYGFGDNTFRPDENVTRSQFAVIINRSVPLEVYENKEFDFADVHKDHWARTAILSAKDYISWDKLENGNYFRPDKVAQRGEIATAVAKLFVLDTDLDENAILSAYADEKQFQKENRKYVAAVIKSKIMSGFNDTDNKLLFKPSGNLTRAQIVQILYNAIVKSKLGPAPATFDTPDNFVGKIGDARVSQSEFYFFYRQRKLQMEGQAKGNGLTDMEKFWNTKSQDKTMKEILMDRTVSYLKQLKVGTMLADQDKVDLTAQEKDEQVKALKASFDAADGEKQVAKNISKNIGINIQQFYDIHLKLERVNKYLKLKEMTMEISDDEVKNAYQSNKNKYDSVTVVHVLFLTGDPASGKPLEQAKQDEAKTKADEILAKVKNGENIKELAKQYSQDPGVTQNSGEYTFQKNGQMVKEFEDWAFSSSVGDVAVVKTSFGYHVMKKIKQSSELEGLARVRSELKQSKINAMMEGWIKDKQYDFISNPLEMENIVF